MGASDFQTFVTDYSRVVDAILVATSDETNVECDECGDTLDPVRGYYPPAVYGICPRCFESLDDDARDEYIEQMCERVGALDESLRRD